MNRTDIINALATTLDLQRYLEIGVRNPGDNFDKIVCPERTGVDRRMLCVPDVGRTWEMFNMTSDEFFERHPNRKFDLIFIDGSHAAEQVRRDVHHALWALSALGFIVMHDCNPPDEHHTHGSLCGTAYQVFLECRANPTLFSYCLDCDYGVGIVGRSPHPPDPGCLSLPAAYDYTMFAYGRAEWLNLISPEDWKPA